MRPKEGSPEEIYYLRGFDAGRETVLKDWNDLYKKLRIAVEALEKYSELSDYMTYGISIHAREALEKIKSMENTARADDRC